MTNPADTTAALGDLTPRHLAPAPDATERVRVWDPFVR
jgi:hypothetical protein